MKKNLQETSVLSVVLMAAMSCVSCKTKTIVVEQPAPVETHVVYSPGENLTALTKVHETEYKCSSPFGGDNSRNLFFTIEDKAGYSNVYRKDNPISVSVSQLTGGHSHHYAPSYCSKTNQVAFSGQPEGSNGYDIYIVNATQGGALTQVTNTPDYYERYPSFSRDGKKIVYEKCLSSANFKDTEIWVKNLQTNENIQLGLGRTPSFSPDGRQIVYVKYASDGYTTCLCVVNIDGSNQTQLTDASMGFIWRPCFSPDGSKIVFQCKKQQKNDFDLYIVEKNGNGLTQLTINKSFDGEPYWSNDNNIYFTSDRGGQDKHYQIWRFRYGQSTQEPSVIKAPETRTVEPRAYGGTYHTVSDGETITNIARLYGITVRDVVKWNNLTTMTLTPGMKLKVSAPTE